MGSDPRELLGLIVLDRVSPPYAIRNAVRGDPSEGGTLDCGIVAHTDSGEPVVIGEIWAMGIGANGQKVRLNARAIAGRIVTALE